MFKTIHTIHFDTIDSTHTWGKKNIHIFDSEALTCIIAHAQTAGYGRHQRKWLSPKGLNIYATLCFTFPSEHPCISNLGQVLALCTVSLLEKKGFSADIKWPNDIRIHNKKIAGILCDTFPFQNKTAIILSIGLNVNMTEEQLKAIDQPAASLAQLSGHSWNLGEIRDELFKAFALDLEKLQLHGFAPFREKYNELLAFKGELIRCFTGEKWIEGICHSVLVDGRLVLILPDNEKVFLSAGEIISNL